MCNVRGWGRAAGMHEAVGLKAEEVKESVWFWGSRTGDGREKTID